MYFLFFVYFYGLKDFSTIFRDFSKVNDAIPLICLPFFPLFTPFSRKNTPLHFIDMGNFGL